MRIARGSLFRLLVGAAQICGAIAPTRAQDKAQGRGFTTFYEILSDFAPAWSPDDSKLVYETATNGPKGNLHIVASSGGKPVPLLKGKDWNGGRAAWSPDGRRIAFVSNRSGLPQLWTSEPSGLNLHQVTNATSGHQTQPAWSPDGRSIAYVSLPAQRIMIISASGGEPRQFAFGLLPSWSPDGKRIAYTSPGVEVGSQSVCIQEVEGAASHCLESTRVTGQIDFPRSASWSPDGRRLVSGEVINGRLRLVIIDVAADKIQATIQTNGSAILPAWSHDGKHIAYTLMDTGNPGEIHIVTPDGKHDTRITRQRRYSTARLIGYRSTDGLDIPGWLYEPQRQRAERRAIVWLHGAYAGATEEWFDRGIQYFVDQGFVVIAPNYRGSSGFGQKLEQTRPGRGQGDIQDVLGAVRYLESRAGVIPTKIAAIGFSRGGRLALLTACRQPHLFSSVVDFFGPTDDAALYREHPEAQALYRVLLGGTPEEKPDAYRAISPIGCVDQIVAPILILHGNADEVCPISHSIRLTDALKSANKQFEFLTFAGAGHGFVGKDLVRAYDATLEFVSAHLHSGEPDR